MTARARLLEALIPASAVALPVQTARERAVEEVLGWLEHLGVQIPKPKRVAFSWVDRPDMVAERELTDDEYEALTDDDRDELFIIEPETPTLRELALTLVWMVEDNQRTYPGPLSWRRWALTGAVSRFLYASGITASGGSIQWNGDDPVRSAIYRLPHWRSLLGRRVYVLGRLRQEYRR